MRLCSTSYSTFRTQTSWVRRVCWVAAWSVSPPWSAPAETTAASCATSLWAWSWSSSCSTTWSPGFKADWGKRQTCPTLELMWFCRTEDFECCAVQENKPGGAREKCPAVVINQLCRWNGCGCSTTKVTGVYYLKWKTLCFCCYMSCWERHGSVWGSPSGEGHLHWWEAGGRQSGQNKYHHSSMSQWQDSYFTFCSDISRGKKKWSSVQLRALSQSHHLEVCFLPYFTGSSSSLCCWLVSVVSKLQSVKS